MESGRERNAHDEDAVEYVNPGGRGRVVLACDHASNHVPAEFGGLGLSLEELRRHIAWDPGARAVAVEMSRLLDTPLVCSRISRLVVDCNRSTDAPDLVAAMSESTEIPGNVGLSPAEIDRRVALAHTPFHAAIDDLLNRRQAAGQPSWLVSIHSFTPVYRGTPRPWHIGIVHDHDERLSAPLLAALDTEQGLVVGDNQPYAPADRVYYTIERHARSRGLPCAMVEIRNDAIAEPATQHEWAVRLSRILAGIEEPASSDRKERPADAKGQRSRA